MMLKEELVIAAAIQITEVTALKNQVAMLTEQVATFFAKQNRQPGNVTCYQCHQLGHLQRYCPTSRRCCAYGQPGRPLKQKAVIQERTVGYSKEAWVLQYGGSHCTIKHIFYP